MEKINISDKFPLFSTHWDLKIIGELNDQHVKLVKYSGEFDWHKHDNVDELFLVISGSADMQFRDKIVTLYENKLIIVPRGIEHCPKADNEVHVLMFEPVSTLSTSDMVSTKTVPLPENI